MVERIPGVIERYKFVDESELYSAVTFSDMQMLHLKSELATAMVEKLSIDGSDESFRQPERFVRAHEYVRGKIDALEWIIHTHEIAKEQQLQAIQFEKERTKFFEARATVASSAI